MQLEARAQALELKIDARTDEFKVDRQALLSTGGTSADIRAPILKSHVDPYLEIQRELAAKGT